MNKQQIGVAIGALLKAQGRYLQDFEKDFGTPNSSLTEWWDTRRFWNPLDADYLRAALTYEPETGRFLSMSQREMWEKLKRAHDEIDDAIEALVALGTK